jgi:D-alanyl-D-alanine carboxypeptidase
MYSVTKTFTSPLILELAREGYFSLEDPVSKFIPFLPYINAELDGSVTIRQLLAHESGWSDYPAEPMALLAVAAYPNKVFTPFEILGIVHQIAPKGTVRSYASTNYTTLGAIVEIATQMPVEMHFRSRFFTPLQLNSMYLSIRETNPAGSLLASPHDNFYPLNAAFEYLGSPWRFPYAWTNVSALPFTAIHSMAFTGGGMVSNVGDLARWGNDLFNARATSQATVDEMMHSISSTPDESGDYLGYGIWTNNRISETEYFVGHNGRAPGYRSVMFYQPDRNMTIAVMTNFSGLDTRLGGLDPYEIAKALFEALPDFIGGNENRKTAKIIVCHNGNSITVDRNAAAVHIRNGAYLGGCEVMPPMPMNSKALAVNQAGFTVYPNPFTHQATLTFKAVQSGPVSIGLYDMNGKMVASLFNGSLEKGTTKQVNILAANLTAGVYFCSMKTAAGVHQQRVVLTK